MSHQAYAHDEAFDKLSTKIADQSQSWYQHLDAQVVTPFPKRALWKQKLIVKFLGICKTIQQQKGSPLQKRIKIKALLMLVMNLENLP